MTSFSGRARRTQPSGTSSTACARSRATIGQRHSSGSASSTKSLRKAVASMRWTSRPAISIAPQSRRWVAARGIPSWRSHAPPVTAAKQASGGEDGRLGDPGYYLLAAGRPEFEKSMQVRPPLSARLGRHAGRSASEAMAAPSSRSQACSWRWRSARWREWGCGAGRLRRWPSWESFRRPMPRSPASIAWRCGPSARRRCPVWSCRTASQRRCAPWLRCRRC